MYLRYNKSVYIFHRVLVIIYRCLTLTSDDLERSISSKYQNIDVWRHWLMANMFMMYKPCICVTIKVSTYSTECWLLFTGV